MKSFLFSLLILLFVYTDSQSQSFPIHVSLYPSSADFVNKMDSLQANAMVKDTSSGYLRALKFISLSGEKIKSSKRFWGLKYNGKTYVNLFYSFDLMTELFVPFDIMGRYCVVIINEDTPKAIRKGGLNYTGLALGGLAGGALAVLLKDSTKWGKSWKDQDEKKHRLLFTDTYDIQDGDWDRTPSSHINFLGKKQLKALCEEHKINIRDSDDISLEEALEVVQKLNQKQ